MTTGLIIAAPHSDAGKTTLTLALLRALRDTLRPGAFKCGPDYIDPRFHEAASGATCYNLDTWAMSDDSLGEIASHHADRRVSLVEGVMGLFDGAADGRGSTAELARRTGWPVVLVVDSKGLSDSVAPLVAGFRDFDPAVSIAGVLLNRVGSDSHEARLRQALAPLGVPVLGSLKRSDALQLPRRHLGLLQADEIHTLDHYLDAAAHAVQQTVDLERLIACARPCALRPDHTHSPWVPDLGPRVAVANDIAFAFCYPHWRARWARSGVTVLPFSPLNDEPPNTDATGVFLPGGYPELHADTLASATRFKSALADQAARGTPVYGECGGFMVLGESLVDADGTAHSMCELLPIRTSFAEPRLHLGYRQLSGALPTPLAADTLAAHEFHYSHLTGNAGAPTDVAIHDALGRAASSTFHSRGSVMGSYVHLIDRPA